MEGNQNPSGCLANDSMMKYINDVLVITDAIFTDEASC